MFNEDETGFGSDHEYEAGSTWVYLGELRSTNLLKMKSLQDGGVAHLSQELIDRYFKSIE